MRRDLIIGILVSVGFHAAFGFGGELFKNKPKKAVITEETPVIEVLIPPPVEPDEPDTVDLSEPVEEVTSLAPPSLVDVPSVVQLDSFTQQVQPPPPPSLGRPTGSVMTIPAGRPDTGQIASGLKNVFDLKDLDQQPQVRGVQAKPNYPFEMKRAGIPGEVVLQFIVDTNGDVRDVIVLRSSQREFEAAAQQAVYKWKFRPGRKGGKAVNVRMQIPIVFNLNDE
jgi:periplasmic protein TonB